MFNLLIPAISTVIDKIFPDAGEAAKAKAEMYSLEKQGEFKQLEAELQLALGQIAINQEEAKNPSLFVSGWRPAVGWVCVFGLTYSFILQPLLAWLSTIFTIPAPPVLDLGSLITLLGGMLGLGAYRTLEKVKKVHRK
tara:strand:+ start:455 stop:868 length:414 start_codon:yes stop_codon:yes gene_type:complete